MKPVLIFALLVSVSPLSAAPPSGEKVVYKTLPESGEELELYVTKPEGWKPEGSRPAIVFFHGGGWTGGAPGQFTDQAKHLAGKGMVTVQVRYRLLKKKGGEAPDTCIADAKDALRWVRENAENLGIDPQRIASSGGSAGGHLAAYLGMVPKAGDAAKSNAMILFNPVLDNGPGGWGAGRVGDRYPELSPFHNVSADDPPMLVMSGEKDGLISPETFAKLKAAMGEAGVRCEVEIYPGGAHGYFNRAKGGEKAYDTTVAQMDAFLASLGWIEGGGK